MGRKDRRARRRGTAPFVLPPFKLIPMIPLKVKLIDQDHRPVVTDTVFGLKGNRPFGHATINDLGEFSTQVPKTIKLDGYQVWHNDGEGPQVTPVIEQRDSLILHVIVPLTPPGASPK